MFFADGLQFDCTRCQRCCRLQPGYVFLSQKDVEQIAAFKNISVEEVRSSYCREVDVGGVTRLSLQERDNYDCILWDNGGCSVYSARPLQCRSFPFWPDNLADMDSWTKAANDCPGIGLGPQHSAIEISYWLTRRSVEPLISFDQNKKTKEGF